MNAEAPQLPGKAHRRRWLKNLGWCFVWIVTLAVLGSVSDNYFGARAWRAASAELRAAGEPTSLEEIVPPPAPDEVNFAAIPFFEPLFDYENSAASGVPLPYTVPVWRRPAEKERLDQLKLPEVQDKASWRNGQFVDLPKLLHDWKVDSQGEAPGEAMLRTLARFDPALEAVRATVDRPRSRFPVRYQEHALAALPHIPVLMNLVSLSEQRALAELSLGQADAAQRDLLLALGLAEATREEPLLISQLVRLRNLEMAMPPLWEGLARHQWNDGQLASFEAALQRPNFAVAFQASFRGERVIFCEKVLDAVKEQPLLAFTLQSSEDLAGRARAVRLVSWLIPSGWIDFNKAHLARICGELTTAAEPASRRFFPGRVAETDHRLQREIFAHRRNPHRALAALVFPAALRPAERFAYMQVTLDLARAAIAIERSRLAHGELPASLPEPLIDAMNGQPLHYIRAGDGRSFTLYSVGWNGSDDHGEVAWKPDSNPHALDLEQGDWGWPAYPPVP